MGSKPPGEQDEDKYTIKMICEAVLPLSDQKIALAAGWKIRQGAIHLAAMEATDLGCLEAERVL